MAVKNAQLNREFLEQYKLVFTEQLIQRAYEDKEHLNGKDILQITPIRQLNLFILKILFRSWQEEMKKLESPFFDYKAAEVRKSMVDFMNTLSQHILVEKEHFKGLVHEALLETCVLYISPTDYVADELLNKSSGKLTKKFISQFLKYLVIHKNEVSGFLKAREDHSVDQAMDSLDDFGDIDKDKQAEQLAALLSEILVVNKSDLITHGSATQPEEDESDVELVEEEQAVEQVEPVYAETVNKDAENSSETQVDPEIPEQVKMEDPEQDQQPTLNEKFELEAKTLADLHEEKKIDSLMDGISINHKYMFIQELFEGESESFDRAVAEVEECTTFDEAVELLVQTYSKNYSWDMNSDEVKELLKVVFRRFR